jgi:hypothetical protein
MTFLEFWNVKIANEYLDIDDPEIKGKMKITHREYFKEHASFKQVANIKDERILQMIHWNFKLIYLRDSAIANTFDERVLLYISQV